MKALILSAAAVAALTLTAASPAFAAKKVVIIKQQGHHDRGLHRGWSHSRHWGARPSRTRVVVHH
jgi:hypothetical protein